MSHFTVLVIGDNPEEQLAPFNENLEVKRYLQKTKQELIEEERKNIEDYRDSYYAEYLSNTNAYLEKTSNENHIEYLKNEFPKKLNFTDEELYVEAIKYEEEEDLDEEGNLYSTRNPNSKWDWYQLGGRWSDFFTLKEGRGKSDQARKGEIDFELMRQNSINEANETYSQFEKELKEDPNMEKFNPYWEYGIQNIGNKNDQKFIPETREKYLERNSEISTFAILNNGTWIEKGTMGWWAVVSDEKDSNQWLKEYNKILDSVSDDTLLSLYDCHI